MKAILAILVAVQIATINAAQCSVADYDRVDCGYVGITQSQCQSKGCCWASSTTNGIPWCFYQQGASTSCYGYQVRVLSSHFLHKF